MARATQPVSINGIEVDALIESSETYEAEAPQYPVETGYSISDTLVLNPMELKMTVYVTDTPVTWRRRHGVGSNRVNTVVESLVNAYKQRTPISIVTYEKSYSNMVITSLEIKKDSDTGYAREIPVAFSQITMTETSTASVSASYSKSGTSGASAGAAKTATVGSDGDSSGSVTDGKVVMNSAMLSGAIGLGYEVNQNYYKNIRR